MAEVIWRHPDPESTQMWKFMQHVNKKFDLRLDDYQGLYKWSIDNVGDFWGEVWDFLGIVAEKRFTEVRRLNSV